VLTRLEFLRADEATPVGLIEADLAKARGSHAFDNR
jgi:hypothetical protein